MRVCSEGRGDLCSFVGERQVKRTTMAKGRWTKGRRVVLGAPGNRYVAWPRKFVRFKKPRAVSYYETKVVYCKAKRLGRGFGDFKLLCGKHAQAAAEEQVKDGRRSVTRLGQQLKHAKVRAAKFRDEKKVLEQRLAARRKS